jgi:NDP-sugar pyrophosphorylase family protein
LGLPLLIALPPAQQSTIAGFTFSWAGKVNLDSAFASGVNLITKYQKIYRLGVIGSDGVIITSGVITSDGVVITDGVIIGDGVIIADGVIASDGVIIADGVIIGDGVIIADGVIASDGVVIADLSLEAQSASFEGDLTAFDQPVVDTGMDCLIY